MKRGAATRGQVAKAMAGAEAIEIKATIPDHLVRGALKRFGLTERNDEERYIYFFDTPELELLSAGIIARARRTVGGEHDSTVKFRPVDPGAVGGKWRKYPGFKIEADASEKGLVKSASFSMRVKRGLIKRVAAGSKGIAAIFTKEQEAFLAGMAGRALDFRRLAVLGPVMAHRWRVEDAACPWPITAELWKRGDGDQMMEVSIKAPAVQAAAAIGGFMAFLAEVGAERDAEQQAKTHWALDYYASRLLPQPGPAAARKAAGPKRKAGGRPRRRKGATSRRPAPKKRTRAAAKRPSRRS